MATIERAMFLWNSLVGWFVAFTIPSALRRSFWERCAVAPKTINFSDRDDSNAILKTDNNLVDEWSSALWWALKLDVSHSLCSQELKQALFANDTDTNPTNSAAGCDPFLQANQVPDTSDCDNKATWIVKGIPERPLYREVAKRLLEWNQRCFSKDSNPSDECKLMVPATDLGFEVIPFGSFPDLPPQSTRDIPNWLAESRESESSADAIIYRILGIRNTVGSLFPRQKRLLLLPSKIALLQAAGVFHEKKQSSTQKTSARQHPRLTVAAKARSKHAHRAIQDASFFGVAKGPVAQQNEESRELIQKLLENCVWINCHVFGGLSDDETSWVVEIREEQGYGARWRVEECSNGNKDKNVNPPVVVGFRGFLEPQMKDGHERRWRH